MATPHALGKAAQAWCSPKTANKEMDGDLAEEFANILDEIWSQPWLGNATNEQLLDELRARIEVAGGLHYKTVNGRI